MKTLLTNARIVTDGAIFDKTDVLIEGYDVDNFMYFGRSRGDSIGIDSRVFVASEDEIETGEIVRVEILDASEYDLTGKTV